jgi:spermidine synthase
MKDPAGDSRAPSQTTNESLSGGGQTGPVALYATAIFASAFLIFLVQPMVGKRILPWFGGVPAVWTLCLAFYQSVLFLGYAYAHAMIRYVKPSWQLWIHLVAVAAALLSLPVLPVTPPQLQGDVDPTWSVLRILTSSVALPFLVLASTGPLVQAWFARAHPTRSPYALYAVSNIGSFLALFAYPFLLEPRLPLSQTGTLWSFAFGATGLAVLACAWPLVRAQSAAAENGTGTSSAPGAVADDDPSGTTRPDAVQALLWILLSGVAVVLLMGVTNKLCLDVASLPFLWILPLATYLITFILAFSSERAYRRGPYAIAGIVAFLATEIIGVTGLIVAQVIAYCALLFCSAMVLHGELYRTRPDPRSLTFFYLCVSAGGAIGGLLVGLVAPVVFADYVELQVGLLAAVVVALVVFARDPEGFLGRGSPGWRRVVAGALVTAAIGWVAWSENRPRPFRVHQARSFFGVLKVDDIPDSQGQQRTLTNGTTVHGMQFLAPSTRRLPTSYFGRATGLGLTLTSRPLQGESRIGVIGLGVGTLAAYGRQGDTMRFYEIDPVVVEIAGPGGHFAYLEESKADVEVVLGDARLSIEAEQKRGERGIYDILVLDAFSSDSIPLHLMTREAFRLYFDALAPNGLMAVHVSNRHFKLMGLVSRLAADFGADSLQIKTRPAPQLQSGLTDWVIIARDSDQLTRLQLRIEKRHRLLRLPPENILMRRGSDTNLESFPLWTDDYSDLVSVIRWD